MARIALFALITALALAASGPVAVVPDTLIRLPTRTAREYPTTGSHIVPLAIFCRAIGWLLAYVVGAAIGGRMLN